VDPWQVVPSWQEYEGSPVITRTRTGITATRVGIIDNNEVPDLWDAIYPPGPPFYYGAAAEFPGYNYLKADQVKAEPFLPDAIRADAGHPLNVQYNGGYKVTIDYKIPEEDFDAFYLKDPYFPVGSPLNTQIWTTWKTGISGEFYTLPASALVWGDFKTPGGNVRAGVLVAQVDHHLTHHFVNVPPRAAIRATIGTVNNDVFLGAPAGCLMYLGAEVTQDTLTPDARYWTVSHKFSEKDQSRGVGVQRKGWNYFLRPDSEPADFEQLYRRKSAVFVDWLIDTVDFLPLLAEGP